MKKNYPIIAIICLILLASCQSLSVGIAKKTTCCDDIINKCTNVKAVDNSDNGTQDKTAASGSEDLLKDLPFSTLVQ